MGGYFLQGTALRELESGMRQIPGFAPRRSGVIRGKPERTRAAPYGELVLLFLEEIPPSRLAVRIINLKNRGEVKEFMFRSGQHKKRFGEICGNGEYDFLRSDHGQAGELKRGISLRRKQLNKKVRHGTKEALRHAEYKRVVKTLYEVDFT